MKLNLTRQQSIEFVLDQFRAIASEYASSRQSKEEIIEEGRVALRALGVTDEELNESQS